MIAEAQVVGPCSGRGEAPRDVAKMGRDVMAKLLKRLEKELLRKAKDPKTKAKISKRVKKLKKI
jgi:hypothetical protein